MNNKQITLDRLKAFKNLDKFSISAWSERGLSPSDSETCLHLESSFTRCADSLIQAVESDAKPKKFKIILKHELENLKSSEYDTEEREFICDYFFQLSNIVKADFKDNLNSWLYGKIASTLFKAASIFKGKEKIIETLTQDCTGCTSELNTFILRKEEGIPDYAWLIIQCNTCNEYNLLSMGSNIKESRFGEYKLIDQLNKTEFTEERANSRLEQIKFFRKK